LPQLLASELAALNHTSTLAAAGFTACFDVVFVLA